jgi:predicted RNA-binding Zn-ribbon protein involved in translation (DUF1610 family)
MTENTHDRPHPHHPPKPCEKCGSTNINVQFHKEYIDFTCNDCGHTWRKDLPKRPHHPPKDGEPETPAE